VKQSYAQLLVHLDAGAHAAARLAVAQTIARSQQAAITALYAVTPALLSVPFAPESGPTVATMLGELDDERREAAHAAFAKSVAASGVPARWAEVLEAPIISAFSQQALYADLLILGQHNPSEPASSGVPADFAESVMVSSGKPALVIPYAVAPNTVAENIVIAWKPTREAAHAVAAAVPLLQRARSVHVISWHADQDRVVGEGLDLARYFKLRGIEASWRQEGSEPEDLGETLLSRAFDLEADLLVMGCYGHSRAREWVLGGTSRTILRSMTLPVLMAH